MITSIAVSLSCLVLAALRIFGFKGEAFQAFAHLFVGGLFVAATLTGSLLFWGLFGVLCVLDLACFFAFKVASRSLNERIMDRLDIDEEEIVRLESHVTAISAEHESQIKWMDHFRKRVEILEQRTGIIRKAGIDVSQRLHVIELHDVLRRIEALERRADPNILETEPGNNVCDSYPG